MEALYRRIAADPAFRALQHRRNRFNGVLTVIALSIFFSYILTIAFRPEWLAVPLSAGSVITRGMPIGFGVIVVNLALIGFYVIKCNSTFDPAQRAIVERANATENDNPSDPADSSPRV